MRLVSLVSRVALAFGLAGLAGLAACHKPQALGEQGEPGKDDSLPPGATPVPSGLAPQAPTSRAPAPSPSTGDVRVAPLSFAPIAHRVDPSVVTITTVEQEAEITPFGRIRPRETQGLGTGFVVDKDGYILTNNHVVGDADAIMVKLSDDRQFPGKLVGTDKQTDVAVVHIDAKDLKPLPLGDSDQLEVGDWVVAVGNPFGLSHTVSAGIVSAKGRTREDVPLDPTGYYNFLQTDASINPGNSGGPLLDLRGEVVGINTAIKGGGAQGIGFAIPINMVKQLLPMLLRDGHVTRSSIGVRVVDPRLVSAEELKKLGLPEGLHGAIVGDVLSGGGADKAGLQPGDAIIAFEGQPLEHSTQLTWLASTAGVGRTVTLRVERKSQTFDLKVTLGRLDPAPTSPR
ncbi:MAG: S1C family serine protease [Polyangiaceae bacterium]